MREKEREREYIFFTDVNLMQYGSVAIVITTNHTLEGNASWCVHKSTTFVVIVNFPSA